METIEDYFEPKIDWKFIKVMDEYLVHCMDCDKLSIVNVMVENYIIYTKRYVSEKNFESFNPNLQDIHKDNYTQFGLKYRIKIFINNGTSIDLSSLTILKEKIGNKCTVQSVDSIEGLFVIPRVVGD